MPHLYAPDDAIDIFRLVLFVISVYSIATMVNRYRKHHDSWNTKTLDSWYALFMWTLGGCVFCVQAIALNRSLTPGTIFMIAAILVTGKAVHKKGDWGGHDT